MAIQIPSESRRFRPAIIPSSIFIFVFGLGLLLCFLMIQYGFNLDWHFLLKLSVFFAIPFSLVWASGISFFCPAAFSSNGIYAHSFWGKRRFIAWKDIGSIRKFVLFNLPWLRIYSSIDGTVTWLPLFQSHPTEFRQTIKELAPPNNPILASLDN
jgi:hypothetical protein